MARAAKAAAITGDTPQNVNFAVEASAAAMFLETSQMSYTVGANDAPLAPADLGAREGGECVHRVPIAQNASHALPGGHIGKLSGKPNPLRRRKAWRTGQDETRHP
jgi:hypothetical protein